MKKKFLSGAFLSHRYNINNDQQKSLSGAFLSHRSPKKKNEIKQDGKRKKNDQSIWEKVLPFDIF